MSKNKQTPQFQKKFRDHHRSNLHFFKLVIKWLGIGLLLLIVGIIIYIILL